MSSAVPPVRTDIMRPAAGGFGGAIRAFALRNMGAAFALLRRLRPILRLGSMVLVTRHDDVREILLADADFPVRYKAQMDVIMGGEPFLLAMGDTPDYRRDEAALRSVIRADDIAALTRAAADRATALVAAAPGRIEVVDQLTRNVTFDVLCPYFGIADTPDAMLRVWATRLFEYQFTDDGSAELHADVARIAPALRAHVDGLIAQRRASGPGPDDVLGRCLAAQAHAPEFSDARIRTALIGFLVGGLPQPPMAVPQALEQLLRRPAALAGAQAAAIGGDNALLAGYVFEALRFDPLAPVLFREAAAERALAVGTARAKIIAAGSTVVVAIGSAMMDPRRVMEPERFEPRRAPCDYLHFGGGLHTCFALHLNRAMLPAIARALLTRPDLARAPGASGHLAKRGPYADALWVTV